MNTNAQNQISGLKNRSEQASTERSDQRANTQTEREDYRQAIDRQQRRENRALSTANVLNLLIEQLPDVYQLAEVVGQWVWLQFKEIPAVEIRQQLVQLGFHWNSTRQAWQHPCGVDRDERATFDPRRKYGSYFAATDKAA